MTRSQVPYEATYYRLAPAYRRSLIHTSVGLVILGVAVIVVDRIVPNLPKNPYAAAGVMWCLALLAARLGRWRIAVDKQGIWRRRLWRWHLGTWVELASGPLKHGLYDRTIVDPRRPWRR
jgi:hypothetical protein